MKTRNITFLTQFETWNNFKTILLQLANQSTNTYKWYMAYVSLWFANLQISNFFGWTRSLEANFCKARSRRQRYQFMPSIATLTQPKYRHTSKLAQISLMLILTLLSYGLLLELAESISSIFKTLSTRSASLSLWYTCYRFVVHVVKNFKVDITLKGFSIP